MSGLPAPGTGLPAPGSRLREVIRIVGVIAVAAALLAGASGLEAARERAYPAAVDEDEPLYLTSGESLRRLSTGMNALAADLYWIRALQHYGGTKRHLAGEWTLAPPPSIAYTPEYAQLFPLLDITTSLDPMFTIAYRFGAVFLAEAYPNGAGRPDLAVRLLEKGLRAQPDKWEYMEDIGFVHYWYDHDYRQAAESFRKAGDVPGAPWWLRSLAATTLAEGGDRRSSRTMWMAIRESAEIDWLRNDANRRLAQLDALDQIDGLQRLVARESARLGRAVSDWSSLVQAGALRGVPVDPSGTPYEITADGHVRLASSSTLAPLPLEPQRMGQAPGS